MARTCSICGDRGRRALVDAMLDKGYSGEYIARELNLKLIVHTSGETINRHKRHYLPTSTVGASPKDLAKLVVDKTIERIESGEMEPTIQHGLVAQQLLDRRKETVDTKSVMLTMARLLSGVARGTLSGPPDDLVLLDDPNVIDAEVVERD